ncbi:hypothetical protein BDV32DRAFT_74009 [Aspergillus pseudonomiae]|uniref:Uncharacterized protein n=2 Tax=Aspergillus subgen. Circumdati TaxID=2720871 RepID=A0A0L1J216_ASPN3|nr:uncharacterized protein ANOM_006159 [Aspergillus nomiae NRRL 13137]XP_031943353.1 uncharacterized protein BDV37DRAFT_243865 [Aspergillus pseudonomiae]KAB8264584.1 hypothetical protein BDV32DRAFT_74009 [Aspergillus pseudonomiae]KAE8406034.1 hypothetical protein BDV37DRAFT_243865 [Aspergillus pseudonomiae]KNG85799.1 hypothetical protein ANOM_006159 [Aspergillus nomiae NRRL 13137]
MAGSPATGSKPEKTMSSRLLTMKFMQRSAATAAAKESSQPPSTEGSNTPTPKRQRFAPGEQSYSPAATPSKDLEAISAALAAEEEKRREAIARQAAESGETEWVIDFAEDPVHQYAPPPFIVANGSLDADDDDDLAYGGRQTYGNFKRKKKTETRNTGGDESGSEEDEDEDEDDVESMINKAKAKASKQPPKVKLSKLTSISGGRQGSVGGNKSQKKRKHK